MRVARCGSFVGEGLVLSDVVQALAWLFIALGSA
jgi:hypothetical protein